MTVYKDVLQLERSLPVLLVDFLELRLRTNAEERVESSTFAFRCFESGDKVKDLMVFLRPSERGAS